MHSVPVIASVTKFLRHTLRTAGRSRRDRRGQEGWDEEVGWIWPRLNILQFSPIFQKFWRINSDFRLSSFRLHLFVLFLYQELLTDRKFIRPGCYVTSLWKYHNISSIQKVWPCSCFVNKSRTNEDTKRRFSRLHTRDLRIYKYIQTWLVHLWTDRILA